MASTAPQGLGRALANEQQRPSKPGPACGRAALPTGAALGTGSRGAARSGRWPHVGSPPTPASGSVAACPLTPHLGRLKRAHRPIGSWHVSLSLSRGPVAASTSAARRMALRWGALCLAGLLLCSAAMQAAAEADAQAGDTLAGSGGEAAAPAEGGAAASPTKRPAFIALRNQDSWVLEGLALALLAAFLVNLYFGRKRNEQLALAWTAEVRWLAAATACCSAVLAMQKAAAAGSRHAGSPSPSPLEPHRHAPVARPCCTRARPRCMCTTADPALPSARCPPLPRRWWPPTACWTATLRCWARATRR